MVKTEKVFSGSFFLQTLTLATAEEVSLENENYYMTYTVLRVFQLISTNNEIVFLSIIPTKTPRNNKFLTRT